VHRSDIVDCRQVFSELCGSGKCGSRHRRNMRCGNDRQLTIPIKRPQFSTP